ncbi:glycoside hydrolase [Streptomyces phyllanthi]|uniref:Ricin-type beta-trefoil lectin domain protein n=1 Tax=Streptomyces phyllanthi TaxID=1803180 RepID=A0A5N8W1E5_9ACTN|nr:glycoside hydrolase [Streptomyces phyllanthi]MPY40922.1 ricin-type beta-trefoil lectin domain protein [Streptomyces phyllanthi]
MMRRLLLAAASAVVVASGTLAGVPGLGAGTAEAATSSVTITPDPSYQGQAFEGWGTSLVWFANATGDYPDEIREKLARLLFDDDGLALNIARYNVGGGNAPDVKDYLRPGGAVEGWWKAPEGTTREDVDWWSADDPADWNPDADATQRWWVDRIKGDIDHWEAFSNSPPWFMTVSGYVSGGFNSKADQLKTDSVDEFADYLVGTVERLEDAHGIKVDTIDPLNEPNTGYWGTTLDANGEPIGGRQEGAHMGPGLQQKVISALAEELDGADTDAVISAMDETNPSLFTSNWLAYSQDVRQRVDQLNVHTYGTSGRTSARDVAKAAGKPLWMSEVEGNWGRIGQNFESMAPGLGMAQHMIDDLRQLEPTAWVFWQPVEDYDNMAPGGESATGGNWGSIQMPFDCTAEDTLETCPIYVNRKFDTARNFTHYIKPGDRLTRTDNANSVAAITADGSGATVVHVNSTGEERTVTLDLSKFAHVTKEATVTPVVTAPSGALVEQATVPVTDKRATLTVPAQSVTSFRIDGVNGVAADAALIQPGHGYRLTGAQSNRSLTPNADGTGVVIRTTDQADAAQEWRVTQVSPGEDNRRRYILTNKSTDRYLAIRDGKLVLEPAQDDVRPDSTGQWIMSTTGDGTWTFVNAATGQLIDVAGQATYDGASVAVWTPNSGSNQRWTVMDLGVGA